MHQLIISSLNLLGLVPPGYLLSNFSSAVGSPGFQVARGGHACHNGLPTGAARGAADQDKEKKLCCPLFVFSRKHGPACCCQTCAGVAGKLGISVATLHGDMAASCGHRNDLRAVSGWTSHAAVRPGVNSRTIPTCKVKSHPDSGPMGSSLVRGVGASKPQSMHEEFSRVISPQRCGVFSGTSVATLHGDIAASFGQRKTPASVWNSDALACSEVTPSTVRV